MSVSRREFAKSVAAVAALPATVILADEPKPPTPDKPDPLRVELALWLELIRSRYPDARLTEDVMKLIAGDCLGDILHGRKVSSFPLKNSDMPAFAMTVYRVD
jgi:hypothetical protein